MATIDIVDVGPIQHLTIPVPEDGGLVVLRARNGRGKSKALEAVDAAVTGRGGLDVRDGADRGSVDAFGVTLKVGKSTRRSGELEVTSLDGKLDVSVLVDPQIKDPEAADAKRIKALVALAGVKPDCRMFQELLGNSIVLPKDDDLLVYADRVKRQLESEARTHEGKATELTGKAAGAKQAAEGVDMSAEADAGKLQAELEAAIAAEASAKSLQRSTSEALESYRRASAQLDEAERSYNGPTVKDAADELGVARNQCLDDEKAVEAAEAKLAELRAQAILSSRELDKAKIAHDAAVQHETTVAKWREQVERGCPVPFNDEAVDGAAKIVAAARRAVERGALIRRAREHLADADACAEDAADHAQKAERLRANAAKVDDVLSGVVSRSGSALRVERGRLVTDTRRGQTLYSDLSHGERWRIALDIAIEAVGPQGVITIPQEAYESLDPTNRRAIADQARERGALVLTAEASDDEVLRAEVY